MNIWDELKKSVLMSDKANPKSLLHFAQISNYRPINFNTRQEVFVSAQQNQRNSCAILKTLKQKWLKLGAK
jgi:hypothetical protein